MSAASRHPGTPRAGQQGAATSMPVYFIIIVQIIQITKEVPRLKTSENYRAIALWQMYAITVPEVTQCMTGLPGCWQAQDWRW